MYELVSGVGFCALTVARWQPAVLGGIAACLISLILVYIRQVAKRYKKALTEANLAGEKEFNELVAKEGVIYDAQLKCSESLTRISGLYEITKEMSTCLHFTDIFRILAGYLQKAFYFKRVWLILMNIEFEIGRLDVVYETKGFLDGTMKAKGIFPRLEVTKRPFNEHDKKICDLLKSDIRRLQIVESQWRENPYVEFLPKGASTYVAIPMMADSRLIGVLAVEDLPASDFEKFSILGAQFDLEMRRIILYEKVEKLAITDGLTKAFARRHIMERLTEEFERAARHKLALSFLMIDIDYFKNYNDTYGHLVGDVVLRDIVALLKENTRELDLVGRFGGEEFCVVLPETKPEEALRVSERIRDVVEKHKFKAYDEETDVTISMGIASFPDRAKTVDELIDNADKALYTAKDSGRNRVCVYEG